MRAPAAGFAPAEGPFPSDASTTNTPQGKKKKNFFLKHSYRSLKTHSFTHITGVITEIKHRQITFAASLPSTLAELIAVIIY